MKKYQGFTLLEVLIAITLTAMVMGSLFAMQSQNKQLTFRALSAIHRIADQRFMINAAWIGLNQSDLKKQLQLLQQQQNSYQIDNKRAVETPELLQDKQKEIDAYPFKLQTVDIVDSSKEVLFSVIRWVKKDS